MVVVTIGVDAHIDPLPNRIVILIADDVGIVLYKKEKQRAPQIAKNPGRIPEIYRLCLGSPKGGAKLCHLR